MRTLSSTLLAEQKKPTRKPVVKVEVQLYGHPEAASAIQWDLFGWQKLHGDDEPQNYHDLCFPSDGSLNRIRLESATIYHQRVVDPDPDSTYTSWTNVGNTLADSHIALGAKGTEIIMVASGASTLYRRESSNSGASWGSWVNMSNTRPCERGCAVAYKPNGDCAVVHASDINDPKSLYIQTRTTGTWSSGLGQRSSVDWEIEGLAMYYDGDWNIIALVIEGSYLSIVRMVYGDGYKVTAGTWGTDQKIGLGRARLDIKAQMATRRFQAQYMYGGAARHAPTYWEKRQAVFEALAGETLDVSGVSLCKPSSYPLMLITSRQNVPWAFRLHPGTDFYDYKWTKASIINTIAPFGMALATDDSYLWATQANEVWRCNIPSEWSPPTPGSGAGDKVTLPAQDIVRIAERIDVQQQSELYVELENNKGDYASPGTGDIAKIKRGSRVNLHIGYRTSSDQLSECGRYFIESWEYNRSSGRASFTLNCIDAWGLLQRFAFSRPVEWNIDEDTYTVYQLIDLVLQAIGGSLSYKSRSSLITSLYPRFDVHAGESGDSVLSRLLAMVPDVIFFFGVTGYIVYPQDDDNSTYTLKFPIR